jgi:lysophospholipase L1-like esterase
MRAPLLISCCVAVLTTVLAPGGAGAAPKPPRPYVALGDSFVAGPLIPPQEDLANCRRSLQNYPHQVAAIRGFALRDVSCTSAQTKNMTIAQDDHPPQFDALSRSTKVVTLGIGGNDIGFTEIAFNCGSPVPFGTPCQDKYVVNGVDTLQQRIDATAPKVRTVLRGIRQRAPKARIYVVGYPAVLPEDSGAQCWPTMPYTTGDVPYLRGVIRSLNRMLRQAARARGATYVNVYRPSIGHDACQLPLPGRRWVEPVVPASPALPVHPNQTGHTGAASVVAAAIR